MHTKTIDFGQHSEPTDTGRHGAAPRSEATRRFDLRQQGKIAVATEISEVKSCEARAAEVPRSGAEVARPHYLTLI